MSDKISIIQAHKQNINTSNIDEKTQLNTSGNEASSISLPSTADQDYKTIVSLLSDQDSNIEHEDQNGFTPLIIAANKGYTRPLRKLYQGQGNSIL